MPELESDSTSPSPPVAVIPQVHPEEWEGFAVFRESFLMYFTAPGLNTALRGAAESFFTLLLEHSGEQGWPPWEESSTRTELRAAIADLRHSVGFLASIGKSRKLSTLAPADHKLSKLAGDTARTLNQIVNGIERKLAKEASS